MEPASQLHKKLRAKDWKGLVACADSLVEQKYSTAAEHFAANQLASLIRKYPFPSNVVVFDKREQAIRKFKQAEHLCKRVNARFRAFQKRNPYSEPLERAARWVRYVLGPLPDLQSIYNLSGWGPGASVGVHGNATNMARKLLGQTWSVSPGAFHLARSAMVGDFHIFELLNRVEEKGGLIAFDHELFYKKFMERCRFVHHNKITFVPKTARIERTIAVEPLLNGFIQKGIDELMRKKLKRVGIDLRDQSRNQKLAREGSLVDAIDPYVTIDLSSASDSLSIELVRYLLPPDWFELLDHARSRRYRLVGEEFTYHKFASMGNGFCFPLETLIFASLCAVAYDEKSLKHDFSVYGDDIIVRESAAQRVLQLLKVAGFRVNTSKTFLSGPFRESCGADWYEGRDVRPITLDYALDSLENIFKFCNLVRSKEVTATFFGELLETLEELIPQNCKFVRPYKGDVSTALEVPFETFITSPFARYDKHLMSWSWTEIVRSGVPDVKARRLQGYPIAVMRAALTGSPSSMPFAERRNTRTKVRKIAYSGATSTWLPGKPADMNVPLELLRGLAAG
jgi:hypothetical protein